MQAEGANSPADIFLTVDAGRIWLADQDGLLQPVHVRGAGRTHPRAPAPPRRPLVRLLAAGAGHLLRQGPGAEPAADLRGAGRSGLQGQDLHPLLLERLQPLADVGDDRQRRRGSGQGLGRGPARQPRARAARVATATSSRALVSGECDIAVANTYYFARGLAEQGAGHHRGRRQHRLGVPEPGRPPAPTSTSPPPASPCTRRTPTRRSASSSIWRRPRPRPISPTRTTSIRRPPTPRSPRSRPRSASFQQRHAEPQRPRREPAEGAGDLQRDRLPLRRERTR